MHNRIGADEEVGQGGEFDDLEAQIEPMDQALGSELLLRLVAEGHAAAMPPAWWRTRILAWCARPSTRGAFGRELTISTEMAMRDMDDLKILTLVGDLLARAASEHASAVRSARRRRRP